MDHADLLAHKSRLINDADFKPGLRELSDVRAVDRLEVTPNGISQFVARDKADSAKLHDHKLAIVASADVVYGMARMYQTLSDDETQHVMVFRVGWSRLRWAVPARHARTTGHRCDQ
jgi:hypothetical protein